MTLEGVTLSGGIKTGDGGGLYASTSSNITLRDNLFMNNRATLKGGGAYITNVDPVLDEIWSDWTLADVEWDFLSGWLLDSYLPCGQ